jgi:hypothetical protein
MAEGKESQTVERGSSSPPSNETLDLILLKLHCSMPIRYPRMEVS